MAENRAWKAYLVLFLGVVCFGFSSILIRLSDAPAPAIAGWRMLLAAMIIAPFAMAGARSDLRHMSRRDTLLMVGTTIAFSIHFLSFVYAVKLTSVASAVLLINAHPIIVALLAFIALREGSRWTATGAVVGMLGIAIISLSELGSTNLTGDMLAVFGACMMAIYIVMTRIMRKKLRILAFMFIFNCVSAAFLMGVAVLFTVPLWPYTLDDFAVFLAMAIVPALLGYGFYNWSLRYLPAPVVSVSQLGESIFAITFAVILFSEFPAPSAIMGGALVIVGIIIATGIFKRKKGQVDEFLGQGG
ncbi:MAG: DMT family transporter [Methanomassiliicoccales archaeon]|nr:DMT family transporter [Methanomassiliicoccales archaeon]